MAGDWIKMRCSLWSHPKVAAMASRLSVTTVVTPVTVIGALHGAWTLFDQHAEAGRLDFLTAADLDSFVQVPGFAEAMIAVEWLELDASGCTMPRYEEHNSASAKSRASAQRRQKVSRAKRTPVTQERDQRREEKRREEKSKKTPPVVPLDDIDYPNGMDTPEVRQAVVEWAEYKRSRGETYKKPADQFSKLLKAPRFGGDPALFAASVEHSIGINWAGCFPPKEGDYGKGSQGAGVGPGQRHPADRRDEPGTF